MRLYEDGGESKSVKFLTLDELEAKVDSKDSNMWAAERWVSVGRSHVLCGLSQLGKSTLGFDLWISLSSGEPWMGHVPTKKMPIYLLDFENPQEYMIRHLKDMCEVRDIPYELVKRRLFVSDREELFRTCHGFDVEQTIINIESIKELTGQEHGMFVVDSFRAAFGALPEFDDEWEWRTNRVREVGRMLNRVIDSTGWGCIGVHHDNSGGKPNGAIQRAGAFDYFLHYTVPSGNVFSTKPRALEMSGRMNAGDRPSRLSVGYANGRLIASPKEETPKSQREKQGGSKQRENKSDKYLAVLQEHPGGMTESKIQENAGGRLSTVQKSLRDLESRGKAEQCKVRSGNHATPIDGWRIVV